MDFIKFYNFFINANNFNLLIFYIFHYKNVAKNYSATHIYM